MDLGSTLLSVAGVFVSLLLAGKMFFIKRLIDKIEMSRDLSRDASKRVEGISSNLREIKSDVKALRKVEIDVAVMKGMLYRHNRKARGGGDTS